jgi:SulP family sulfate permease
LRRDAVAAVPTAVAAVPDGMAASLLAGINPIHGLYASFAGRIAGALFTATPLMVVTTTSAAALTAGSAVQGIGAADRADAVFLLTLVAGVAMVAAGVAGWGRYVRFVPHSVMVGFLTGVAANIVLGQVPDLTGASGEGPVPLVQALDVVATPSAMDPVTVAVASMAILIAVGVARTRWASVAALLAVVVPTAVVVGFDLTSVARVRDLGEVPAGLPVPGLPSLDGLSLDLLGGALAVAVVVLVQGAGVAESTPTSGPRPDPGRVFVSQGAGNIAAGLLQGQPVGGSVGQTALNQAAGASSRWAAILSGCWIVVILVLFATAVGTVPMATLAAVLVVAAASAVRPAQLASVWRSGARAQVAIVTTFVATLALPIAAAVGVGLAVSLLLQLNQEALDLRVVELIPRDGRFVERPAPSATRDDDVVLLDVYGSLLYAGSRTLQAKLPDPTASRRPAVVLRLRGRVSLGATFFVVIAEYAERLSDADGRLFLSGVDAGLAEGLRRSGLVDLARRVEVVEATEVVGESTQAALAAARSWLERHGDDDPAG